MRKLQILTIFFLLFSFGIVLAEEQVTTTSSVSFFSGEESVGDVYQVTDDGKVLNEKEPNFFTSSSFIVLIVLLALILVITYILRQRIKFKSSKGLKKK